MTAFFVGRQSPIKAWLADKAPLNTAVMIHFFTGNLALSSTQLG